ncbi:hypothetical protein WN944_019664 [Citrus x changshan-huyou]|uniref:Uncharacterized protein n=1 Tax=Citrus x changshan-huyou TaxID=2935761 RepID=A0AAP0LWD0_9ROSI
MEAILSSLSLYQIDKIETSNAAMAFGRALFRHQWTLRKGKIDGGGVMFGGKGPCAVSMARTTTTVENGYRYREKFELLSERLWKISESVLEGNFIKGLKPEIRVRKFYKGTEARNPSLAALAKAARDLLEGLNQLEEGLKDNIKRLSSFDKYKQEVLLGHLDWSPMHNDPLF